VHSRNIVGPLVVIAALGVSVPCASASAPHVVQPGETLWSIAASNNLTTRTVAAFNGLAEDAQVVAGSTIEVPTEAEGAAALQAVGITPGVTPEGAPTTSTTSSSTSTAPRAPPPAPTAAETSWLTQLEGGPAGIFYLAPAAAESFEAMRQASFATYGIDLYPGGPLSAFRTYAQQSYFYELYLSGQGNLAAPPGSSSHELGVALDLADPSMRPVVDEIGPTYGWYGTEPSEWWHIEYLGG
jgi:murein DD-endopeptidase MepM/ murein hydrolase activator NlpD